jgi:hypothetical protein
MWAMTGMDDPLPIDPQQGPSSRPPSGTFPPIFVKLAVIGVIFGCVGVIVTLLMPKPAYEGRLVGQSGDVHIYAVPTNADAESLAVWHVARKLDALPADPDNPIQQFDLSSSDRQAAGTRHPDLVVDGWSGGMHCCLTRFVFDGPTGKLIGSLSLGSSSASRFIPLNHTDRYPAAFLAYDDATLDGQSEISGTPLAPILVVWRGKNFGLFIEAMKATTADSPSPYLLRPDFEEARLELATTVRAETAGTRGDVAKALNQEAQDRLAQMKAATLNPEDAKTFAPLIRFLNDYVYKGQAEAGVAIVKHAHAASPDALSVALQTYAEQVRQSQWIGDLNVLNDGKLISLLDQIDRPMKQTQ